MMSSSHDINRCYSLMVLGLQPLALDNWYMTSIRIILHRCPPSNVITKLQFAVRSRACPIRSDAMIHLTNVVCTTQTESSSVRDNNPFGYWIVFYDILMIFGPLFGYWIFDGIWIYLDIACLLSWAYLWTFLDIWIVKFLQAVQKHNENYDEKRGGKWDLPFGSTNQMHSPYRAV